MERPDEDVYTTQGSVWHLCSSTTRHYVHRCEASFLHCETKEPISYSMSQSVDVTDQGDCIIDRYGYDQDHIMTSTLLLQLTTDSPKP